MPTQTGPTFTWRCVSGYVGPCFCDVTRGLLQRRYRWGYPSPPQTSSSEYWMLPLASSVTRGSTTADSAISCTTSCTGWTFLRGCSKGGVQRYIDVCSTKHHSTWRTAASTPQTLLVASICGPPAAISCSYFVPRHRRSMFGRRAFSVPSPATWNSLLDYLRDPSRSFYSFCLLPETFLFSFLLAYTAH